LSLQKTKHLLKAGITLVTAVPSVSLYLFGSVLNRFRSKKSIGMLVRSSGEHLHVLKTMAASGKLEASIEEVFPLNQVRQAHTTSESGRVVGKVVMSVD
jgi:NADPH:quinone reductase-like Zn-dependent oxidoreductase